MVSLSSSVYALGRYIAVTFRVFSRFFLIFATFMPTVSAHFNGFLTLVFRSMFSGIFRCGFFGNFQLITFFPMFFSIVSGSQSRSAGVVDVDLSPLLLPEVLTHAVCRDGGIPSDLCWLPAPGTGSYRSGYTDRNGAPERMIALQSLPYLLQLFGKTPVARLPGQ